MPPGKGEFHLLERPEHFIQVSKTGKSSRGGALAITIALHVVVVVSLIVGLHAAHTIPPQAIIMATVEPIKRKPVLELPPPPQLVRPPEIIEVPPPIVVQTEPSSAPVAAAVTKSVAPAPPPVRITAGPSGGESRDTFLARLLAQLNQFKRYPVEARKAHVEGVVMLHFVMDPSGKVVSFEIAKSSGRPVLDDEALALIQRAQPLPSLPAGMSKLDAIVPIEFSLNA